MEFLSNISSIMTVFLFLVYFIGRFWTISKDKKINHEKFEVKYITENENFLENDDIDDDFIYDLGGNEVIEFKSSMYINWIKVYEINYNENFTEWTIDKRKPIFVHKNLNINESIYIKTFIPEVFCQHRIEYERYDYTKVGFNLGCDGRQKILAKGFFKSKLTFKGYLYYLFR